MRKLWTRISVMLMVISTAFVMPAMAVLDAEETAVFTDITAKVTDLKAAALPLLATILVAFIGYKLLKKFANRAV